MLRQCEELRFDDLPFDETICGQVQKYSSSWMAVCFMVRLLLTVFSGGVSYSGHSHRLWMKTYRPFEGVGPAPRAVDHLLNR